MFQDGEQQRGGEAREQARHVPAAFARNGRFIAQIRPLGQMVHLYGQGQRGTCLEDTLWG